MKRENPLAGLLKYIEEKNAYLLEVDNILGKHVPKDEPEKIKEHLIIILSHRPTIATIFAKLEKFLDDALAFYLPKKEKSETDLDRKYALDAKVAQFRYWRNFVELALLKTIDMQASAMQSLLSYEKKHLTQLGSVGA